MCDEAVVCALLLYTWYVSTVLSKQLGKTRKHYEHRPPVWRKEWLILPTDTFDSVEGTESGRPAPVEPQNTVGVGACCFMSLSWHEEEFTPSPETRLH